MPLTHELWRVLVAAGLAFCLAVPALAEEASQDAAETESDDEDDERPNPNRYELAPFPALGGNTDEGVLFGINAAVNRLEEGYDPYRWRLQVVAEATVKPAPGGGAEFPAHRYEVISEVTGLAGGRLRLRPRAGYRRIINAGYFGLAGLSAADPLGHRDLGGGRQFQYLIEYPEAELNAQIASPGWPLEILVGLQYRYVMPHAYSGSMLEDDLGWRSGDDSLLLPGYGDHSLAEARVGILWDRRDHEIVPTTGTFTEVSLRGGVGAPGEDHPFAFGGVTTDLRYFMPLLDRSRLVLAARLLFDVLFGEPPFYELSRAGTFFPFVLCSGNGVRGAPDGRHSGEAKLLGILELRSLFAPFRLFRMNMVFGMSAHFAVGQTWTALRPEEPIDGPGPAATWGAGVGLNLRWGESLVVRGEVSYSPDATDAGLPVGIYFNMHYLF